MRTFKFPTHGCGDVCLDIDAGACKICGQAVEQAVADIRDIPYPDQTFGAAFASHVLEHLPTVADAKQALKELYRVANEVFIAAPSRQSFIAWLHPDHHLWVKVTPKGVLLTQR